MIVIESIRKFIKEECPILQEFEQLFQTGQAGGSYMVQLAPGEPTIKRYVNGDSVRHISFYFSSSEACENVEAIDVSAFYEKFSNWMEECTRSGNLPVLEEGKEAKKIKVTTYAYPKDTSGTKARYQIQCEFQYYQKAVAEV